MENLDELISAATEFEGFEDGLQMFLDRTSLIGETDQLTGSGQVTLMTIHSAKGLEFSNVFLVGLEEGLFPHQRSLDSDEGMEEERRLFYVGLTRARKRVFLTHARARRFRGTAESRRPSPFLDEIPQDLVRDLSPRWETLPPPRSRPDRVRTFHDPDEVGYSLGQQVHHPTLGVGTVIGIEGAGENLKLTISFPGMRAKKIMARYTNMEPVTSA
jgi:DNA helicase-2/ATP-dependent DNA helicase PcrA